jgi:hypothetical protein
LQGQKQQPCLHHVVDSSLGEQERMIYKACVAAETTLQLCAATQQQHDAEHTCCDAVVYMRVGTKDLPYKPEVSIN